MKRPDLRNCERKPLVSLRQVIVEVGFHDGTIRAYRHDGRITKVDVQVSSKRDPGCGTEAEGGWRGAGIEQVASKFHDCLDKVLQSWPFRYGKFEFEVAGEDVKLTTISISLRPHEEELIARLIALLLEGDFGADAGDREAGGEPAAPGRLPPKG